MKKNEERLLSLINSFQDTPILVVGDLILDHYIWGKVNRISPEAPVVVVQVSEEDKRPGGAGNVAQNLISLGAQVSLCGVVGDDKEGRELLALLDASGMKTDGVLVDRQRPTTVKTRVIAHGQQVVRVDREEVKPLAEAYAQGLCGAMQAKLLVSKGVIISDYAKGAIVPAVFDKIRQGVKDGVIGRAKVPVLVDPKAPHFSMYGGATIMKPNRIEAQEASGVVIGDRASAKEAGKVLLARWSAEMVLITLGEEGMVLVSREEGPNNAVEIETRSREVYDVSGAGDTVSAVFMLALTAGATPAEAAELANRAAGIVIGEVGTVAVTAAQLKEAVKEE